MAVFSGPGGTCHRWHPVPTVLTCWDRPPLTACVPDAAEWSLGCWAAHVNLAVGGAAPRKRELDHVFGEGAGRGE